MHFKKRYCFDGYHIYQVNIFLFSKAMFYFILVRSLLNFTILPQAIYSDPAIKWNFNVTLNEGELLLVYFNKLNHRYMYLSM